MMAVHVEHSNELVEGNEEVWDSARFAEVARVPLADSAVLLDSSFAAGLFLYWRLEW